MEIKQAIIAYDPKMNQDLPSEIVSDILLRLPLENVVTCKCVCKQWLNVAETDDFVHSHLSKSAPTTPVLVVSMPGTHSNWFNVFRLEDEHEHGHKHDPIIKFDFPQASTIQGSANGLLLLKNPFLDHLYVCNPITREFVELSGPHTRPRGDCYGFGVGKISGKHKVVYLNPKSKCHAYTLETGSSWRRIEAIPLFDHCYSSVGAFVNGNLHWLVSSGGKRPYICCFNVETECFSTFSAPIENYFAKLYTLGDCLCYGEADPYEDDHVMWLLTEYEEGENGWSDLHVILPKEGYYGTDGYNHFQAIKVYANGDMLILWDEKLFAYYCNKENTMREIGLFGKLQDDCYYINSVLLAPNFLSLSRNLRLENVMSF